MCYLISYYIPMYLFILRDSFYKSQANFTDDTCIVHSFKFILKVGVEESIVNALYELQLFKSYGFTRK
jgi:hypothetical protein